MDGVPLLFNVFLPFFGQNFLSFLCVYEFKVGITVIYNGRIGREARVLPRYMTVFCRFKNEFEKEYLRHLGIIYYITW